MPEDKGFKLVKETLEPVKKGYAAMTSLINKAQNVFVSEEEKTHNEIASVGQSFLFTKTILVKEIEKIKTLVVEQPGLASVVQEVESGALEDIVQKILKREKVSNEEAKKLNEGMSEITLAMDSAGLTFETNLSTMIDRFDELLTNQDIDQKTRKGMLKNLTGILQSNGVSSKDLKELKRTNLDDTKMTREMLTRMKEDISDDKIVGKLTEIDDGVEGLLLTNEKLEDAMTQQTKSGDSLKDFFEKNAGLVSGGRAIGGGLTDLLLAQTGLGGLSPILNQLGIDPMMLAGRGAMGLGRGGLRGARAIGRGGRGAVGRARGFFRREPEILTSRRATGAFRRGRGGPGVLGRAGRFLGRRGGLIGKVAGLGGLAAGAIGLGGLFGGGEEAPAAPSRVPTPKPSVPGKPGLLAKAGKAGKFGLKGGLKVLGKVGRIGIGAAKAIPGLGTALAVGMALWDFSEGFTNAAEIAGIKPGQKVKFGTKVQAGLASAISGLTFGLAESEDVFKWIDKGTKFLFGEKEGILAKTAHYLKLLAWSFPPLGAIIHYWDEIKEGMGWLYGKTTGLLIKTGEFLSSVMSTIGEGINTSIEWIEDGMSWLFEKGKGLLPKVGAFFKTVFDMTPIGFVVNNLDSIEKGITWLFDGKEGLLAKAGKVFDKIKTVVASVVDIDKVGEYISGGVDLIFGDTGVMGKAKGFLKKALDNIPSWLLPEGAKEFIESFITPTKPEEVTRESKPEMMSPEKAIDMITKAASEDPGIMQALLNEMKKLVAGQGKQSINVNMEQPPQTVTRKTQIDDIQLSIMNQGLTGVTGG